MEVFIEVTGIFDTENFIAYLEEILRVFFYLSTRNIDLFKRIYDHSKEHDILKYKGLI